MLHRKDQQQDERAQKESRIDPQSQTLFQRIKVQNCDLPCPQRGVRVKEHRQVVTRSQPTSNGQNRCPGQPVAPDRKRRQKAAVAHPGRGAIDGRPAAFRRKEARDLGIDEGLDKAETDRQYPDYPRGVADGRGDPSDRK